MPNDFYSTNRLLTIPEVAELLNTSETTVRRWIAQREIPFLKLGGSIRFDRKDITAYLDNARIEPIGLQNNYGSKKT